MPSSENSLGLGQSILSTDGSTPSSVSALHHGKHDYGLASSILSSVETFAQSVAGIAPSAQPAMTAAIVFGLAGYGSWLTYLIATATIILTALCIKVYAERSSSPGSLYAYACKGGGLRAGFITGWSIFGGYVVSTACCTVQCTIFINALLEGAKLPQISPLALSAVVMSAVAWIAYKNIKLSANLMLWLEIVSIGTIATLLMHSVARHGWRLDMHQLSLQNATPHGIAMGLVMAILAFVGFESAATLGSEASVPQKRIPQALIWSVLISGAFFVLSTVALVQGFESLPVHLESCPTPLPVLANYEGLGWLGMITNFGAAISFFACCLALTNAAARIAMTMSHDGMVFSWMRHVHKRNRTPYAAILTAAGISLVVCCSLIAGRYSLMDIVGWTGSLATYNFIVAYIMVSVTVPSYLKKLGELTIRHRLISALAGLSMLAAFLGTVFPIPPAPYCWLPYICLTYLTVGFIYHGGRAKLATPITVPE